jgi:uracil-DNA glycosylase
MCDLFEIINLLKTDYKEILLSIIDKKINDKCVQEVKTYEPHLQIFPPRQLIFKCFDFFNVNETKVVILGQDPYINPGEAMGLCFSVPNNIKKVPPSLINIKKELKNEFGKEFIGNDLTKWAQEGVLLLNSALTVLQGKSNFYEDDWEEYTDKIIKQISLNTNNVVFILWVMKLRNAISKKKLIDDKRHLILESAHPSPLSAFRGFFSNNHFKLANEYLENNSKKGINWI